LPPLHIIEESYLQTFSHSLFLVNLDYVIGIKNYIVYMVNGIEIPLSQRKSIEFHNAVNHFLAQTINVCKGAQCNA
jgi:hypothetical protein